MKYYDNSSFFELSLPVVPREFEMFNFYFVRAKTGTDYFWVKRVQHEVFSERIEVAVWLEGQIMNKYREIVYDKARFQGYIGLFDEHQMTSSEIDKLLRDTYRD
jgi:hypothetical protein